MLSQRTVRVVAIVMVVALVLSLGAAAFAQEPGPGEVPTQDIVPEPNSGSDPEEPGDRGGALQLALLAGIVVTVGGIVWHIARQSRRARQESSASQASIPSTNPDR